MTSFVWIVVLASLVATQAQDLDLFDALDDTPTEKPKVPEAPKNPDSEADKPAVVPPKETGGELDLLDAFGDTPTDPKKPAEDPVTDKPAVVPPKDGGTGGTGGGSFSLDDLGDVAGGSDYKPDGGKGGARASDPGYDGPANDQPAEASSGQLAAILSSVGVAIVGAASSYFAYQKKKLCFKLQGGADPESGKTHQGTESDPQVLSNLLRSS